MRDKKTVVRDALEASVKELLDRGFTAADVAKALGELATQVAPPRRKTKTEDAGETE